MGSASAARHLAEIACGRTVGRTPVAFRKVFALDRTRTRFVPGEKRSLDLDARRGAHRNRGSPAHVVCLPRRSYSNPKRKRGKLIGGPRCRWRESRVDVVPPAFVNAGNGRGICGRFRAVISVVARRRQACMFLLTSIPAAAERHGVARSPFPTEEFAESLELQVIQQRELADQAGGLQGGLVGGLLGHKVGNGLGHVDVGRVGKGTF